MKDVAFAYLGIALMVSFGWAFARLATEAVVGSALKVAGYTRQASLSKARARLERQLSELEVTRSSPARLETRRARLLKELESLDKAQTLPPNFDALAERTITLGPWALLVLTGLWVWKTSREDDARIRQHAERRAADEAERTRAPAAPLAQPLPPTAPPRAPGASRPAATSPKSAHDPAVLARVAPKVRKRANRAQAESELKRQLARIADRPNMPAATDAAPKASDPDDEPEEELPRYRMLTAAEWHGSTDVRDLVRHAINRIPRQHFSLFLAAVAEDVWPHFHARRPQDWRPAWAIATLRAWCFGEATVDEVRRARDGALQAHRVCAGWGSPINRLLNGASPEAFCASRVAAVACAYASDAPIDALWADAAEEALSWACLVTTDPLEHAVRTASELSLSTREPVGRGYADFGHRDADEGAVRREQYRRAHARYAELMRTLVPYPSRPSSRWERRSPHAVRSSDATLLVDGWRVLEARGHASDRRGRPKWMS